MTGRFIVFEGGDGAGKSTAAKALVQELRENGEDVILTREPGGSPHAEEIRTLLLQRRPEEAFGWDAQTLLFYAARLEHLQELIIPSLQAGKIVICDRFELSTYQYQITAGEASLSLLRDMHKYVNWMLKQANVNQPEYVVLALNPDIGLARVRQARLDSGDDTPDVFDEADIEFHRKLQAGIDTGLKELYVPPAHRHLINAEQSPEAVLTEIKEKLGF